MRGHIDDIAFEGMEAEESFRDVGRNGFGRLILFVVCVVQFSNICRQAATATGQYKVNPTLLRLRFFKETIHDELMRSRVLGGIGRWYHRDDFRHFSPPGPGTRCVRRCNFHGVKQLALQSAGVKPCCSQLKIQNTFRQTRMDHLTGDGICMAFVRWGKDRRSSHFEITFPKCQTPWDMTKGPTLCPHETREKETIDGERRPYWCHQSAL